jgi:putative PEP-CTERM system TPR-repeat lipoprotein
VRLVLIDVYLKSKDVTAALLSAREGVAAVPESAELWEVLGRTHLAAGEANQAIASFAKQADLQPRSPKAHLRLAEIYASQKRPDEARMSLQRALTISPNLFPAQRDLIMLELGAGRRKEAMAIAQRIRKTPGREGAGLMLVGDIEASQRRWAAAAAAYRSGLAQPNAEEFASKLHSILVSSRQQAAADQFSTSWLKDHPKSAVFLSYLGGMALLQEKFDVAEAHYRTLIGFDPNNAAALNNLAWATSRLEKPGAMAYAERANQLKPNQPAFMDTLALLLADGGGLEKAIELESKVVAMAPDHHAFRLNLAKFYIKGGQGPLAKAELEKLAKLGAGFSRQAEVELLLKTL